MALTEVQIANYVASLNMNVGSSNHLLFEKLLLVDSLIFNEVMEKLVNGVATLDQLKALPSITDDSLSKFLFDINSGVVDASSKRAYYLSKLETDFLFSEMKANALSDFSLYMHKKFIDNSNWTVKVNIDPLGLQAKSYLTFGAAKDAYMAIVQPDAVLAQKYAAFNAYHAGFAYKNSKIKELVDLAITDPIFIDSILNPKPFSKYPEYRFILSESYKFISPAIFSEYKAYIVEKMVLGYDSDDSGKSGWPAVQADLEARSWNLNASISLESDFVKVQLARYRYPLMYGSAYYTGVVDPDDEKAIIDSYISYFDLAREVIQDVSNKIKIGMGASQP